MSDWEIISSELRKARKPHKCIWCGQSIEIGARYRYERVRGPDGMDFNPWHLECDEAHREASRVDHDGEFTPYDNERPALPQSEPQLDAVYINDYSMTHGKE